MDGKTIKTFDLIADNLMEFGRLAFAGFVVGGFLSDNPDKFLLITYGGSFSLLFITIGILIKRRTL
ncbi:hypothetical protein FACS189452_08820 [Bacteroidia bacterium]|nr:hypothetical protein FACS189452_08820 [Bacteroidia bacterium]